MKFKNLLLTIQTNSSRKTEKQLKILEKSLDEDDHLSKYNAIKSELDLSYVHITESIRIRSKSNWYEHSEKSNKTLFEFIITTRSSKHNKKTHCS